MNTIYATVEVVQTVYLDFMDMLNTLGYVYPRLDQNPIPSAKIAKGVVEITPPILAGLHGRTSYEKVILKFGGKTWFDVVEVNPQSVRVLEEFRYIKVNLIAKEVIISAAEKAAPLTLGDILGATQTMSNDYIMGWGYICEAELDDKRTVILQPVLLPDLML
jgi:hypothetical protein